MTVPLRRSPYVSRLISALPPVCAVALSIAATAPAAQARTAPAPAPLIADGGFEAPAIPANIAAIVKHAIESQGGSISVTSRLGTGSTFTIRLPV